MFASRAFPNIPISMCQITIEIYKREERKPSVNKLGPFGEEKNQTIFFGTLVRQNMTQRVRGRNGQDFKPSSRQTQTANFAYFSSYPKDPTEKYINIF